MLDYFQVKLMIKFFEKSKKPYSGVILCRFCPNLHEKEFSWKKSLSLFLNIPIIYHRAKNQKKLTAYS